MEAFYVSSGKWVKAQAIISKTGDRIDISIVLANDSLCEAYLCFSINNSVLAVFRIYYTIKCDYNDMEMVFTFMNYHNIQIIVICSSLRDFQALHSQTNVCSRISKDPSEVFIDQNILFLQNYGSDYREVTHSKAFSCFFPIVYDQNAKNTWFRRTKYQNSPFFMEKINVMTSFITWNVAQIVPTDDVISTICQFFRSESEFVFITLQEVEYSVQSVIAGDSDASIKWHSYFSIGSSSCQYKSIFRATLGGVYVEGFQSLNSQASFKFVENLFIRFGIGGVAANKSAILTRIIINETGLLWAGAHLDPHAKAYEKRNQQIQQIWNESLNMPFDYFFLTGDLNYRITIPYEEAIELARTNSISELFSTDQLSLARKEVPVLNNFNEPRIDFLPTYRYDKGTNVYDTSQKKRVPSWTDRVLVFVPPMNRSTGENDLLLFETDIMRHMGFENLSFSGSSCFSLENHEFNYPLNVELIKYISYQDIMYSDHRPVEGQFQLPTIRHNEELYKVFLNKRIHKYDEICELSIPKCKVMPNSFSFNKDIQLNLINVSCVDAEWRLDFIPNNLILTPTKGIVHAGSSAQLLLQTSEPFYGVQLIVLSIHEGNPAIIECSFCK